MKKIEQAFKKNRELFDNGEMIDALLFFDIPDNIKTKEDANKYIESKINKLKQLEEENKQLKNNIELMSKYNGENIDELIKLREEERKLREGWHAQCEVIESLRAENETLTRENENRNDWIESLNKKCEDLIADNERLKETLSGKTFFCENCEKLARENERLKARQLSKNGFICDCEEMEKLRQENEELKKENEEINSRMSAVIYRATGGRLCYSNYTLDAIEQAFQDQLEILSDRKAEEAEEVEQENEEFRKALEEIKNHCDNYARTEDYVICGTFNEFLELIYNKISEVLK